jgi:hypothetical protein
VWLTEPIFHQRYGSAISRIRIGLDHPKQMRDLELCLGFAVLNLALSLFFFSLIKGTNKGGIKDSALMQRQAFFLHITVDDREDYRCVPVLFQQVPEVHGRDFVDRFFHGRIAQGNCKGLSG